MGLKTFNLDNDLYSTFSDYCKKNGISMSKRIENFIREEIEQIKSGGKLRVKRFVRDVSHFKEKSEIEGEHSFKKYC